MIATKAPPLVDLVPADAAGAQEIRFTVAERYNASRILFDNLAAGRGERTALVGPGGQLSYAELCAEASRWGNGFRALGLKRGDRILMFLDDTPAYPAAFFGAVRSGFVPLLINTLSPADLLEFYLADSGATVAVTDAADVLECAVFGVELPDRRMTLKAAVVMKQAGFEPAAVTSIRGRSAFWTNCRRPAPARSTGRRY